MKNLKTGLILLSTFLTLCITAHAQSVFINEIHYDNDGADQDEGVEVLGPAGTDLSSWSLVLYNGNGGSAYNIVSLDGVLANQQSGVGTAFIPIAGLQNGSPDGIALINGTTVIQFLSYEGSFTAVGGPADGLLSDDIGEVESSSTAIGTSLQLTGQGSSYSDFTWQTGVASSYNAINNGQSFGEPTVSDPIINEFVNNHSSSDTNEFVEIFGDPNTDYSSFTLIEIEGDGAGSGVIDEVIVLGNTDSNGYWTTGFLSNAFENGTLSFLLVENFTGNLGDDLDTDDDGILDTTPWDQIVDAIGVNDGGSTDINYGGVALAQSFDGGSFTVGGASRIPNATDTDSPSDWVRNDFDGQGLPDFPAAVADGGEAINTPGLENIVAVGPVAEVVINEIDADTESTDVAEFIELYDGGAGNTPLDGLVVVFYNGSNDQSYRAIDLDGYTTNNEGYFVLGNDGVPNVTLQFPSNGLQNGADAVAVYAADDSDFPSGTPITTENLIDAVVYDTNDSDDAELLTLLNAGEPQLNEDENGNKDTESLQRLPNGSGGLRNTSSFAAATPTPGTENGVIVQPPTPDVITIAEARSKAVGELVTVRGVLTVTSNFGGPAYIQDATGGIPVFDAQLHDNVNLQIGDSLEVTASRAEFNSQVQLSGVTAWTDLGPAGNPITPAVITLAELANHPGELVQVADVTFNSQSYILFGNSNYDISDLSGGAQLRIDADVESLVGRAQPEFCENIVGVVGRFIDIFQLLPRAASDMPCAVPYEPVGGDLGIPQSETFDITTWNIEWFGDENNSPAAGSANSDQVQKDSVKAVLLEIDADVFAVEEITDTTLFVQMVSEMPGYAHYISNYVSYPSSAGEKQHVAFIYKTSTVQPIFNESKPLLASIHPYYNGGDGSALVNYPSDADRFYASGRLPYMLVVNATINGVTKKLNIVDIHARANSGSDSQNRYDMRKYDVEVLKDSLDTYYSDANVILLGDYNDDVDETVADITSTISSYVEYVNDSGNYFIPTAILSEGGYRSYVFNNDVIDHIAVSNELQADVVDGSARVGYEFYDTDYAYTASDHMPVSVRFKFEPEITFNTSKAVSVVSFNQGRRKNGRPVVWWRSDPSKALGRPLENFYFNFVSLGFGGEIVLELDDELYDLEGDDFRVFESTLGPLHVPCGFYPERAEVFVSEDGNDFTSLGTTCLGGTFDLASQGLRSIRYIKIVDQSNPWSFGGNADGYDLDGIWPINHGKGGNNARTMENIAVHENYAPNEEGESLVDIYPNPFVDKFTLNLDFETAEHVNLKVYNSMGHEVYRKKIETTIGMQQYEVDLNQLASGVYVLKVNGDQSQNSKTIKLIKK